MEVRVSQSLGCGVLSSQTRSGGDFRPPELVLVLVLVLLVLMDYGGLCVFLVFHCLLAGKHSREVSKGKSSPFVSSGESLAML
jgi:hypothetical protein